MHNQFCPAAKARGLFCEKEETGMIDIRFSLVYDWNRNDGNAVPQGCFAGGHEGKATGGLPHSPMDAAAIPLGRRHAAL